MLIHKGTIILDTDRLILRRFKQTDAEDMFKNWGSDEKVTRFLSWPKHSTVSDSEEIIGKWISEYEESSVYNWVIELKEICQVIGGISVVRLDSKHMKCEIGYCISSKYWNMGVTTEALKKVIDFLFEEVGMNRIAACHDTKNVPSGQVMKKSGMLYEGTLRQVNIRRGKFYDLAVYSILKDEWEKSNEQIRC